MNNLIGLDIGEKRIGVARVNLIAKIPEPIIILANDGYFKSELSKIYQEFDIDLMVIGLPRNLDGKETAQSAYTRNFVKDNLSDYKYVWQDETLSSKSAAENSLYQGAGLDAAAACIILEDYLRDRNEI